MVEEEEEEERQRLSHVRWASSLRGPMQTRGGGPPSYLRRSKSNLAAHLRALLLAGRPGHNVGVQQPDPSEWVGCVCVGVAWDPAPNGWGVWGWGAPPPPQRDGLEGKGPQRQPQKRLGGWRRMPKRLGAGAIGYKCH